MVGNINKQGNWLLQTIWYNRDRYHYDIRLHKKDGWIPYRTDQDCYYFGIWVNKRKRCIITYAEGDEYTVHCVSDSGFRRELEAMDEFYETKEVSYA